VKDEFKNLGRAIVGFPKFLVIWVVGLVAGILSDYGLFGFVLVSVAVGFLAAQLFATLTAVLAGFVVFFGLYARLRIIVAQGNAANSAIVNAGGQVRMGLAQQAYLPFDDDGTTVTQVQ
jgi:hypothetical protein